MPGEYIVDDRTWIVKSHHPMIIPHQLKFETDKIILCVRNPVDVFTSLASFANTMSHSGQPEYSYQKDYAEWWDWWITLTSKNHSKWFEIMLRHMQAEG